MKASLIIFLLSTNPALSEVRVREKMPPVCNQGAVMECVRKHEGALARAHAFATALDPQLAGFSSNIAKTEKNMSALKTEKNSFSIELEMLREELNFLRTKRDPKTTTMLSSHLSIEDYFSMPVLHRDWRERYPVQRAEKLTEILDETGKKESDLITRIARTETEITNLNNEFQSLLAQKNKWLAEAHAYYGMINGGCRSQVCPSGF